MKKKNKTFCSTWFLLDFRYPPPSIHNDRSRKLLRGVGFFFPRVNTLDSREHGVALGGIYRADQDSVRVVRKLQQLIHLNGEGGRAKEQAGTGRGARREQEKRHFGFAKPLC